VNAAGENDYTALHGAAYVGAESIIRYLVAQGAKMDARDKFDQTPLSIAQGAIGAKVVDFTKKPFGPHPEAAEVLVELGAR
jgi:ankyrin repeat protein